MPKIVLNTYIKAPVQKVFDLSRSIDLHQHSMQHTNEKAVAGRTFGLIELNETVTWQAKHLFKTRSLTSRITEMNPPYHFRDVMVEGDFKMMEHDHYFSEINGLTKMKDVFRYSAPFGWIGKIVEILFLTKYLTILLRKRNEYLKQNAELADLS
jgi:ligand-binding SRPBCC domain-containing protein